MKEGPAPAVTGSELKATRLQCGRRRRSRRRGTHARCTKRSVGRVVGALGCLDVMAITPLVGAPRRPRAARPRSAQRVPRPPYSRASAPAASELVGIALVVIASAVAFATRPRR